MDKSSIASLTLALILAPALVRAQAVSSPSASPAPPVIAAGNSTVIQPDRLTALLPAPPAGWNADKPEGAMSESGGFQITTVSCVYVQGDADNAPTATLSIVDSANNKQFQDATKAMWSATSDTPQGYNKAVTVNGLPGFEHYAYPEKTGVLWVVVSGRFFVQVETTGQPPAGLRAWLNRIPLNALSTLK